MGMENGWKMGNSGGESSEGAVVGTTQWEDSEFSSDQTKTGAARTEKLSLIQLLFEAVQILPHTIQEMESQRKELGCLLEFWSWDLDVPKGEHRSSKTGLKMMNSVFHVGFGVSVTHSVDNIYSYIYPYWTQLHYMK